MKVLLPKKVLLRYTSGIQFNLIYIKGIPSYFKKERKKNRHVGVQSSKNARTFLFRNAHRSPVN